MSYIDDSDTYFNISTHRSVPAIKIRAGDPSLNITKYFTGMFSHYSTDIPNGIEFIRTVSCTEKFKDGPASLLEQFPEDEDQILPSTGWLCPDIDELNIKGYFSSAKGYSSYEFSVTYCDVAAN